MHHLPCFGAVANLHGVSGGTWPMGKEAAKVLAGLMAAQTSQTTAVASVISECVMLGGDCLVVGSEGLVAVGCLD